MKWKSKKYFHENIICSSFSVTYIFTVHFLPSFLTCPLSAAVTRYTNYLRLGARWRRTGKKCLKTGINRDERCFQKQMQLLKSNRLLTQLYTHIQIFTILHLFLFMDIFKHKHMPFYLHRMLAEPRKGNLYSLFPHIQQVFIAKITRTRNIFEYSVYVCMYV